MSKVPPPQLTSIQDIVDECAQILQRSVEVTTPAIAVIAASAQIGAIDKNRAASILNRTPPPEPIPWMLSFGIQEAVLPVRLPANPRYDMLPRVVIPLRHEDRMVGYLWIIDEPALGDAPLVRLGSLTAPLARLIDERDAPLAARAQQLGELAREVLTGDPTALAGARERDLLPSDGVLTVHRVLVEGDQRAVAVELARPLVRRPFLVADSHDSLVLIECRRDDKDTEALMEELQSAALVAGAEVVARGSAPTAPQARLMADVAKLCGQDSLRWEEAGAWRLLRGWELTPATVVEMSPDAAVLLDDPRNSYWQTLLTYFEHSRNVSATAAALYIHRATLHYRLDRVREILGPGVLDDGWRCAALYVALKLHAALQGKNREAPFCP